MLDTERAYIAGLFDGDGSVFMRKVWHNDLNRDNVIIEASFTLQSMKTLEWLASFYGGTPKQSHVSHRAYTYKLGGSRVFTLLKDIEPYVITKKEQVAFVLFAKAAFFFDGRGGHGSYSILTPEIVESRSISCDILHLLNKRDSMCFHGKSGELSESLTSLMVRLKDMMILSQATVGIASVEGATTRELSPNNNTPHERPASLH
jgi:hypothetical protein